VRTSNTGRPRRTWLLLGIAGTVLVIVLNTIYRSATDSQPNSVNEARAYIDAVRPILDASVRTGADLTALLRADTPTTQQAFTDQAARIAVATQQQVDDVQKVSVADDFRSDASLVQATLVLRARAAATVNASVGLIFSTTDALTVGTSLADAGADLVAADRNYQVFYVSMQTRELATGLPSEPIVADPASINPAILAGTVTAIRNQSALSSTGLRSADMAVLLVTLDPPVVRVQDGISIVVPTDALKVSIVVANLGTETVTNVQVTATVAPTVGNVDSARDFVSLEPGQRYTVRLGGLRAPIDVLSTFTAEVAAINGEVNTSDNVKSFPFRMDSPNAPASSTP